MKVYKRTENGVTTNVSIREGLAEVERADREFDTLGIRSRSSKGSTHFIEYGDGRKVLFELTEVPDVKLTDAMKDTLRKLNSGEVVFADASTWRALERRGLITANTAPWEPMQGTRCLYMLTDAGREAAAGTTPVEDAPQEHTAPKPVTPKGRKCLEYVRRAGRPVPLAELSKAGFNGNTVNSIDGCLRFRPEPYIQRTPAGYVLSDLGRRELSR
ncbi:hypothetical protein ACIOUE_01125 [Streptomyces xanthochromogenes]|uniref:hypothetical protein n=1 Tax=Streptomyces xanthochromogenes TaxID=67384 RepID=UPI0038053F97